MGPRNSRNVHIFSTLVNILKFIKHISNDKLEFAVKERVLVTDEVV